MKRTSHFVLAVSLFCGVFASAQTPPVSTEQKPAANPCDREHTNQTAASAILQAARQSAELRTSGGNVEITSDTMGVDFRPYLADVLKQVRNNWYNLIPEVARPPLMKKGKVSIAFSILKDGSVAGMKLESPSGDVSLDRAAWVVVLSASAELRAQKHQHQG